MYRAEILGIRLPSTVTQKPVDELAITSGSRLSNDSGYIDEGNGKTSQQTASTAKSLEDWRTSGTLEQLAELQINDQLDKKETTLNEANKVTETLEDAQLKQKEDALRLQRELFSSIANQKPPTDVVSKTLRALDADESVTNNSIKNQVNDSALTNQVEEDRNLNDIAESEEDPVKNLLSPNRDKISDEEWQKLNTPRDKLEEEKRDDPPSTLLQVERISLIPPTPRKEDIQKKKVLKDLEFKRQHKDSSSTDSSSLDTEAEQQKLSEMGSTSTLMKSTIQKMHKEIERLTADQRELCRVCYQKIEKQPIPFGLSIMIRLFSNHPQYKDIWPQFKQIPDSSLMHAPELRRHARIYMAGLRLIINSMNDDDKLETALRGIAQAHVKWHIHKYHLINMLPCVIESFQAKFPMNVDQVQAWTTLFDVIANLIDIFRSH